MLRTVHFHGKLKRLYGAKHTVVGNTWHQIVNGLTCQLGQKFKQVIKQNKYHLFKGKKVAGNDVGEDELPLTLGKEQTLHIMPVTKASGSLFRVVVGVVLIVVGTIYQQPWMQSMGAAMVLGGISEMLAPKPKSTKPSEQAGQNPSFIFNGTVNVTEQGGPPPIIYGRVQRAGSIVLSAGLTVERI